MPALPFSLFNSKDTSEPVSADSEMEESGTSIITPTPASSSRTSDTNQRGTAAGPTRIRHSPYVKDKSGKTHAKEHNDSAEIITAQATEIDHLRLQASTNGEMLEVFKKQMEDMRRELDQAKETAADIEQRVHTKVSNIAAAEVSKALDARRVAEDEVVEARKREAEAEKRAMEALKMMREVEQQFAEGSERAKITLDDAQKVAEDLLAEKLQQDLKLAKLEQQLKEKEARREHEDEVMEDADIERNKQAAAALEDAKRREEMLMSKMREQSDLVADLMRQLQEKGKEKETEPCQPEDEHMEDDSTRPANAWPSVPKPMQPQRPIGGAGPSLAGTRRRPEPPLPSPLHTRTWEQITENTEFDNEVGNNDSSSAAPSLENLDAKLNMLLQKVLPALQEGRNTPRPRKVGKEFKTPAKRVANHPDKNTRNKWVRFHMNALIGIDKDEDIKDIEELILPDSPLNLRIATFEKDARIATPPDFKPMRPNLNIINGRWNDKLFDYFLDYCRKAYGRNIGNDEEIELLEIFKDRISSMRKVMKRYRPKESETMNEAASRARATHLAALDRQRRNTRRNETFNIRFDTTTAHILVQNPGAEWLDNSTVVGLLGSEGMSSDESDVDDSNRKVFKIKTVPWRNPILTAKLQSVDADRNTANVYGNSKGGTPPRMRKRKDGRPSSRKPPTGKPINFYDPVWYAELNERQKRDIDAKPAVRLMVGMEVE